MITEQSRLACLSDTAGKSSIESRQQPRGGFLANTECFALINLLVICLWKINNISFVSDSKRAGKEMIVLQISRGVWNSVTA